MRVSLADLFLILTVAVVWFGCLAFVRLKTPLDRLHCAAFVNVAAGASLTLAVILQDGATSRSWKTAAIVLIGLAGGAATSHAIGRALFLRGGDAE